MTSLKDKEYFFKELDEDGMSTLEAIAAAPALNEWIYKTTSKNLNGRILEIGSGIGNISECYFKDGRRLLLSDIRDNYCEYLKNSFESSPHFEGVRNIDLVHPEFDAQYADLFESFDGLFALNVVEHISDDRQALVNARKLLKTGGDITILVPAYQFLFNHFDEALEHYRRYTRSHLEGLFKEADLQVSRSQYFNLAGIAGWYVSGKLQKNKVIPGGQMKLYNTLVPIFKLIDKITFNRVGLSIIVFGKKV